MPLLAVTVTAGVIVSPASSSESVSAGVARARAAGIYVSPAAARMMTAAPKGSCMADPTRRGCPKVKRIIARAAAATGCRAAAAKPDMDSNTSIFGPGYSVSCGSNTAYNEIITTLRLYNDSRVWQNMDTVINSTHSSHSVGATARYTHCVNRRTPVYLWRTKAYSYSKNKSGTAYTNTLNQDQLRPCQPS
jgi:hypothetical protein